MMTSKQLHWLVYGFLAVIVAIVFQQIATSMTEQGIASGGPYNNGAAYPKAIAIAILVMVVGQILVSFLSPSEEPEAPAAREDLQRALLLLIVFGTYLALLKALGYHLTTTPMIFGIMLICGARKFVKMAIMSLIIAFAFAFAFEKILNVVLPGGVFGFNLTW